MNISMLAKIGADIVLSAFAIVLLKLYLDTFFKYSGKKIPLILSGISFFMWQFILNDLVSPPSMLRVIINILLSILVSIVAYEGSLWKKTMFSISYHTIWMLMQSFCSYVFMLVPIHYTLAQIVGGAIPEFALFLIFITMKPVFRENRIRELSKSSTVMLSLVPIGSMLVVNNTLCLSKRIGTMGEQIRSFVSLVIVLGINIMIFYIYLKLAEELELRRCMTAYKQQLDLCERHQKEREISMLEVRNLRHNMKNKLITIMTYARRKEYTKIVEFIDELLQTISKGKCEVANSGNIIVDSILNYRFTQAKIKEVEFTVEMKIPMQLPFKGADLCLILGNALENAEEATEEMPVGKRFIHIRLTFDKGNLLILIRNSYKESESVKEEVNPGIGLHSIYKAVEKYHGTVMINRQKEIFELKILLYQL